MDKKSVKKYIYWGLFLAFIVGSIITGGPFNLIDLIIVRPIVNIQFMIFNLVHDFGLAIIIFAVLVKLVMWPLTKKQLNQTRLIRKLQPELTKIKNVPTKTEEASDDPVWLDPTRVKQQQQAENIRKIPL